MSGIGVNAGPWTALIAVVIAVAIALGNYAGSPLLVAGALLSALFVGVAYRAYRQTV
ncbi:hypothetical protein SAMN04487950_0161 [Halogranum rubrum]|uniref:Uncharacterized protein n=1 Tax=Halogranum rubrum TaxID=553466 RepID=A0A1I4AWS9_9EURY|nr:hypothetical protein [Halogranum rubrum]SFK61028.1 hypothetical protein SAMN04487950_0161 [Halogranum rubrum]